MAVPIEAPTAAPLEAPAVPRPGIARAGVASGLAGGLAMLVPLALVAGLEGLGWLHPVEAIGATAAAPGSPAALATGLLLHALASSACGLVFAAILPEPFPSASAVAVGGGYGLVIAGTMMSVVVPAVSPAFRSAVQPVGGSWVVAHVLFGTTMAYTLVLWRRASRRRPVAVSAGAP